MKTRPEPAPIKNRNDLIKTIERFQYRNLSSQQYARAIFSSTSPSILADFKKKELFDLLKTLAEKSDPQGATYLYQDALSKESKLGQRFRKQGPIHKSGFTRGTIKDIYELLFQKQAALKLQYIIVTHDQHIARGKAAQKRNDLKDAINEFNYAIRTYPHSAEAYFELGETYFISNDNKNAIQKYSLAIWRNPKKSAYYYARADAFRNIKSYEAALNDINEAIDLDESKIVSHHYLLRANIHHYLNNLNEALADHNMVIKHYPKDPKSFLERGKFYEAAENMSAAFNDYIKAAKLYKAASPLVSTLPKNSDIYSCLQNFFDQPEDVLKHLSNNDLIKMLTDITTFLNPDDALSLCQHTRNQHPVLAARFRESEKIFGIFTPSSESLRQQVLALENSFKPQKRSFLIQ